MSESPPRTQPRQRRWRPPGPPDNEIPHSAPVHTVLGRGPDAALFLVEAQAYTTGVLFSAALRLRRRFDSYGPNMHMELMGSPTRTSGADDPDERLMLGVQLSDGRRTIMTTGFLPVTQIDAPADPGALSLTSTPAGSIGDLSSDVRYFSSPGGSPWASRRPSPSWTARPLPQPEPWLPLSGHRSLRKTGNRHRPRRRLPAAGSQKAFD